MLLMQDQPEKSQEEKRKGERAKREHTAGSFHEKENGRTDVSENVFCDTSVYIN